MSDERTNGELVMTAVSYYLDGQVRMTAANELARRADERDAALARNERLGAVIAQAHYKLKHHSAAYEAMRLLGAALDTLCADGDPKC